MDDVTKPQHQPHGVPLKGIQVDVLEGPDAEKSCSIGEERITVGTAESNQLVLRDPAVSRYHLTLVRERDRIRVIDNDSTNGTRIGPALLRDGSVTVPADTPVRIGDTTLRVTDGRVVSVEVASGDRWMGLVGRSPMMRKLMALAAKLASQEVSVLIFGESGTGKELIARAIHDASHRAGAPFVTVDCAAIPPSMFSAELFGHQRGAFTGAERTHVGALERASGGTLFLDEVGELPLEMQSTLLGCLERRRIVRLGGDSEISIEVRVVAASNRNLLSEVNSGGFRLDLFYRLAVVQIAAPSLRDHREDLPVLIEHFLREAGYDDDIATLFPADTMSALKRHTWPGNVRELRNIVASTLALGQDAPLNLQAAGEAPGAVADTIEKLLDLPYKDGRNALLSEFEARYLARLLERSDGSVRRAAREARMDRSYLTELLKRHGLR